MIMHGSCFVQTVITSKYQLFHTFWIYLFPKLLYFELFCTPSLTSVIFMCLFFVLNNKYLICGRGSTWPSSVPMPFPNTRLSENFQCWFQYRINLNGKLHKFNASKRVKSSAQGFEMITAASSSMFICNFCKTSKD